MFVFGVIFALVAGILFGLIGPTTKIAYNAGASVPIAIFLRYAVATIIIFPFLPYQKNLLDVFKKNLNYFISISVGSIFLTLGFLTSVYQYHFGFIAFDCCCGRYCKLSPQQAFL